MQFAYCYTLCHKEGHCRLGFFKNNIINFMFRFGESKYRTSLDILIFYLSFIYSSFLEIHLTGGLDYFMESSPQLLPVAIVLTTINIIMVLWMLSQLLIRSLIIPLYDSHRYLSLSRLIIFSSFLAP